MDFSAETLSTGLVITVIGMAVVLAFLTIMIAVMNFTAKMVEIINKYFPEPIPEVKTTKKKKETKSDEEIAIAIALACKAQSGGQ